MAATEGQAAGAELPAAAEGRCGLRFSLIGWFEAAWEGPLVGVDVSHTLVPPPGAPLAVTPESRSLSGRRAPR